MLHVRPTQQRWPEAPQAWHELVTPPSPAAVTQAKPMSQVPPTPAALPPQQRWPEPPHASQVPAMPPPAPTQVPPAWQMAPGQQAPFSAPQFSQVRAIPPPGFAQARPALQVLPAQQAVPVAPQARHEVIPAMPATGWQERPAAQALGLAAAAPQQRSFMAPQATHMRAAPAIAAAAQTAPEPVQMLPAQQTSPTAPHGVGAPASAPAAGRVHAPAVHIPAALPPIMHVAPAAVHRLAMQQPPPLQALAAQQG
jgi:hypothetical protein